MKCGSCLLRHIYHCKVVYTRVVALQRHCDVHHKTIITKDGVAMRDAPGVARPKDVTSNFDPVDT